MEILKQTFAEWQRDKVPMLAAALAYYTVFSIAPLLIIVIAVLTFLGQGGVQSTVVEQIRGATSDGVADLVGTMIENRRASGGNVLATIIGVVVSLVGATTLFVQLQNALNTIWGVKPDPESGGIGRMVTTRLVGLGMVLVIGLLLLASLLASTLVSALASSAADALPGSGFLWSLLDGAVSLALVTLLFAAVFKVLPDARITWRSVAVGALVTAVLFVVGKWALGLYLSRASVAGAYGAAGSLVVLLLWVFYSAQILLLGGEFTQVYARRAGHGIRPDEGAVRTKDADAVRTDEDR